MNEYYGYNTLKMTVEIILLLVLLGLFVLVWLLDTRRVFDPDDPCYVKTTPQGWNYYPNGSNWLCHYVTGLLVTSGMFTAVIYLHNPSAVVYYSAFVVQFVLPVFIANWSTSNLAISANNGVQTWTLNPGNRAITIPIGAIHDITVQEHLDMASSGPDELKGYFRIEIEWYTDEAELRRTKLYKLYGPFEAQRVAAWLKQQCKR